MGPRLTKAPPQTKRAPSGALFVCSSLTSLAGHPFIDEGHGTWSFYIAGFQLLNHKPSLCNQRRNIPIEMATTSERLPLRR